MTVGLQIHCCSNLPGDNSVWGLHCGDPRLIHVPNVLCLEGLGGTLKDTGQVPEERVHVEPVGIVVGQ